MFGLSYNCSTEQGFYIGAPEEGFDIAAVASTLELMEAYAKENVKAQEGGETTFSTSHTAVGEYIEQLGNSQDHMIVAIFYEMVEDGNEEYMVERAVIFEMNNTKNLG